MQPDARHALRIGKVPCQHCSKLLHYEQRTVGLGLWIADDRSLVCMRPDPSAHPSQAVPHWPMPQIGADHG